MAFRKRKLSASFSEGGSFGPKRTKDDVIGEEQLFSQETVKSLIEDLQLSHNEYESNLKYIIQKLKVKEIDTCKSEPLQKLSNLLSLQLDNVEEWKKKFDTELLAFNVSQTVELTDDEEDNDDKDALSSIKTILADLKKINADVELFQGSKDDKQYLHLDELLIRNQIKLDNVESSGNVKVKQERKKAIQFAQSCQSLLNSKAENSEITDDEEDNDGKDALNSIKIILEDMKKIKADVELFQGSKDDKQYLHLDELLITNQIKLDNVESNGNVKVKQERKKAIQFAQSCQSLLNSKADN